MSFYSKIMNTGSYRESLHTHIGGATLSQNFGRAMALLTLPVPPGLNMAF